MATPTLLAAIHLPLGDSFANEAYLPDSEALEAISSPGALGLDAVLIAFVLVELAALAVPRWRRHRLGPGRVHLARATMLVGAVLVLAQAAFTAWAASWIHGAGLGPILVHMGALVAGVLVMLGVARAVTRFGLGHGLSVVAVLGSLPAWLERLPPRLPSADAEGAARTLILVALVAVVLVGRPVRGVRLPVAGLVPILFIAWLLQGLLLAASLVPALSGSWLAPLMTPSFGVFAGIVGVTALGWAWLFAEDRSRRAWAATWPALAISVGLVLGVVWADRELGWLVSPVMANVQTAYFFVAVTVAVDVVRELGARWDGPLTLIETLDSVPIADRVGQRLAEADIAFVMRGLGHRTLLRVFGPWVPIRLFVAAEAAEEALALVRDELGREDREALARVFQ
ncbi:MAG: hypothetical protein JNJ59_00165 [Deltaproteobacteria bacterium]|nr:hypothetical protein [Deltaproteobacteria bacterium]